MSAETIQVSEVRADPGAKSQGFLQVGETGVGPIRMPLVVINGTRPGPTLCLTAGVHAAEYPAIAAVMQVSQQLNPEEMAGAVLAVPVVNQPMYQARAAFTSPIDGLNLNRTFPGKPNGSITEMIAHTLVTELFSRSTHHIDCHGGDVGEILWPYAGYSLTGKQEQDEVGEAMVRVYTPRIFALYREDSDLPPTRGSSTHEASRMGVVSMLAECGSNGGLDEADVRTHANGITNVMRFLGILPGKLNVTGNRLRATGQFIVYARRGGLVRLSVGIGENIKEDQQVGEILDVFGNTVEKLYSPADGIVRIIWNHKVVNSGDSILKCWTTEPASSFPLTDQLRV